MSQQILLLKLLTIPVYIIKFISKIISMLTYLPNYFLILILDMIIFNQLIQNTFDLYLITWSFRLIALNGVTLLFAIQFYGIHYVLDIEQKQWYVQLIAVILVVAGLLFLMRKGYLQMIQKFNPIKLKSPKEHVQMYWVFVKDTCGILLALINIILVTNSLKTFSYRFISPKQLRQNPSLNPNPFLTHIRKLIHKSLLYNLTFFYVKVFFRVFSWRYKHNINFVEKQQDNILNLMVLLTLLFWQTILDIAVVVLLAWVCLIHWKRGLFRQKLRNQQRKYMVTLTHFGNILIQLLQLLLTLPFIIINPTATISHLKTLYQSNSPSQSQQFTPTAFLSHTVSHMLYSLLKIPAYLSLVMILIFRYKYLKFLQVVLPELKSGAKPVADFEIDKAYMKLFAEQMVDSMLIPLVIVNTLCRPWNYKWLGLLVNDRYDMERKLIVNYFWNCMFDIVCWMPTSIILSVIMVLYCPIHIYTVAKGYYIMRMNTTLIQSISSESIYKKYSSGLYTKFIKDLPFLPFYSIANFTLLKLFDQQMTPNKIYTLFQKSIKMFYLHRVKSSPRAEQYFQMFNKDLASGLIQHQGHKMRFWKFAHKCQRHILLAKIIQFMVPKRRYQKKIQNIQKETSHSAISNEYWYRYTITLTMLKIWLFFMIEIFVTLVGVFVLAPLTLWRLPTFVIVFNVHRSKRFFFKVLFEVYKVMAMDLAMLTVNVMAILVAPVSFLRFRYRTMFRYGKKGYEQLLIVERMKNRFVLKVLIVQSFITYWQVVRILTIMAFYLRKKAYLLELKRNNLSFSIIYNSLLRGYQIPEIQSFTNLQTQFQSFEYGLFQKITQKYYNHTKGDIPYLLLSLLIMLLMPWRYHYLKKALSQMKDDIHQRYQVIIVLKKVFKDYLCILLNIILVFSVVKTRKALQLIARNYRLNFFVGFLKYSFLKQLTYELLQAVQIYYSILLIGICVILDWQHLVQLVTALYTFWKDYHEQQLTKEQNQKIFSNTVKQNKQLKILDLIGFNEYVTLTQFLDMKDLARLARVNKMNYMMLQRQQIWIDRWQRHYSQQYQQQIKGEDYRTRCIKAYQHQSLNILKPKNLTFNQLVRQLFALHIYKNQTNLPQLVKPYLNERLREKLYKNYTWSIVEGYGPRNELPQEENEDEEFLRLTNQVRRPKVELGEFRFYLNLVLVRPVEGVVQGLTDWFRVDAKRRFKQLTFIGLLLVVFVLAMLMMYFLLTTLYAMDRYIGLKLLSIVYLYFFTYLTLQRCNILYSTQWISLTPFDLYYDVKNFIISCIEFIRIKIVLIKNFLFNRVYTPTKTKLTQWYRVITIFVKKVVNMIVQKIKGMFKTFVDKVAAPLYMYCVQKIVLIKKIVVMLFNATRNFIVMVLKFIKNSLVAFKDLIVIILSNLNGIYFKLLFHSRRLLMRLGIIGQLIFTLMGLCLMTLPSIICYFIYSQRWYVIVSTIHTAVLIVLGYKHLNKIKLIGKQD